MLLSGGIGCMYASKNLFTVSAAQRVDLLDTSKMMAAPVTELEILSNSKDDMKTKMELLVLRIQVCIKFH